MDRHVVSKWGQLSLNYLDVESLPLIGKPAVIQTESLDRSPLLWTLSALLSCVATSRIFSV